MSATEWKFVPVEPTQSILDAMTTERKKGNGVLQMWFEAMAAAPVPPSVESLLENWTPNDRQAFSSFINKRFPGEMSSYAIQSLGSAWKDGQANAQPKPAAHLTIPGALEWDGDNGTHGAAGESRAHGEYREAVRDAIAETLGDAYDCTRVWAAWGVGTMSEDDFSLICDDESRLEELTEAAIQAYDGAEVNHLRALLECSQGDMRQADQIMARQRVELDNLEQSRRSFFDLSQDLEKRLAPLKAFAAELISAGFEGASLDGGDIQDIGVKHGLLRIERRNEACGEVCACREYGFPARCYRKTDLLKPADEPAAPAKCESCGDWGHIETEDSAHDCPECGPSVVERAVEAGVMNAPKPYVAMTETEADEFLSSFGGGSGNKAKRRIAAIQEAKQKTCIECDQPYCHGVCVERGDQDYDRDQTAKGGVDE